MPILGSSDSHACFGDALEPGNFTIVFAEELTVEAIKNAILKGFTIAGNANKLYGDYRLVKFGYFLLRNFYPEHNRMRNLLGARMLRYASGRTGADSELASALKDIRPSEMYPALKYI